MIRCRNYIAQFQVFHGFQTPQFLAGLNAQNETNLHNI
jgi:hypothetical protein